MSKRTIGSALAATGMIAATALAVLTAGPAAATGNGNGNGHDYGKCEEIKHYDLKDVTHEGGGSAELTRYGLRMKTPGSAQPGPVGDAGRGQEPVRVREGAELQDVLAR